MATSLTIQNLTARVNWDYQNALDWGNAVNSASFSWSSRLSNGTGASQADVIFVKQGTLAGAATLNVDLAGGSTDMYGNTITMARVKVIYVELTTDTTSTGLYVGGHTTAALVNWISSAGTIGTDQPKILVRNGGVFYLACTDATGYAVTATTADTLKLTNADGTNTATYKLAIVGASA